MNDLDKFKWKFREKEIADLRKDWYELDAKEDRQKQDFDSMIKNRNLSNFNTHDDFKIDIQKLENDQRADNAKWEFRDNLIKNMERKWLEQDVLEAKRENNFTFNNLKNKKF